MNGLVLFRPKDLAARALSAPPLYSLIRRRALRGNPITILCYHTLGTDTDEIAAWTVLRLCDFARQVKDLRRVYDIVDLETALARGPGGNTRPMAVLTFDDGDIGLHTHLLPFVERVQVPVTVYVATAQIERGTPYWFDRVMNALQAPEPFEIDLRAEGLNCWALAAGRGAARWAGVSAVLEALKAVPPDRREDLTQAVCAQAPDPGPSFQPLAPMTPDQLRDLACSPWVRVEAHSHCHNLMDQIPAEDVYESARCSRTLLEGWTGQPVRHFAYPNGNRTPAVAAEVMRAGFQSATILGQDLWRPGVDPMALPRLAVGRFDTLARFRLMLAGM